MLPLPAADISNAFTARHGRVGSTQDGFWSSNHFVLKSKRKLQGSFCARGSFRGTHCIVKSCCISGLMCKHLHSSSCLYYRTCQDGRLVKLEMLSNGLYNLTPTDLQLCKRFAKLQTTVNHHDMGVSSMQSSPLLRIALCACELVCARHGV